MHWFPAPLHYCGWQAIQLPLFFVLNVSGLLNFADDFSKPSANYVMRAERLPRKPLVLYCLIDVCLIDVCLINVLTAAGRIDTRAAKNVKRFVYYVCCSVKRVLGFNDRTRLLSLHERAIRTLQDGCGLNNLLASLNNRQLKPSDLWRNPSCRDLCLVDLFFAISSSATPDRTHVAVSSLLGQ